MAVNIKEPKVEIRSHVREHYGKIAADFDSEAGAACCGPADSTSSCCEPTSTVAMDQIAMLYEAPDAADLPPEVTGLSLGCGDPVTLASLQPGQTVLDLGSGGGIDCFLAAKRVGESGRVIGVDMTSQMIEKARANKAKVGAENVEFRLGEIEHIPAADSSVDVIISNCVINLSPDKSQVFGEAYRVLRPGGRFSVTDIVTDGPLPKELKDSMASWAGCVSGALDVTDFVSGLKNEGFVDIEVEPVYFERSEIKAAAEQTGLTKVIEVSDESLYKSLYSAKITAAKPQG
jgi:SAM-dependent methyltransferase